VGEALSPCAGRWPLAGAGRRPGATAAALHRCDPVRPCMPAHRGRAGPSARIPQRHRRLRAPPAFADRGRRGCRLLAGVIFAAGPKPATHPLPPKYDTPPKPTPPLAPASQPLCQKPSITSTQGRVLPKAPSQRTWMLSARRYAPLATCPLHLRRPLSCPTPLPSRPPPSTPTTTTAVQPTQTT